MAQREGSARNDRSRACRRRGGRPGSTRLVSFLGSNFGCSRESKRGFANPRELYRTKIGNCQRRVNGAFVVECVDLRREAVSLGAVASQKAENESSARPQNAANLPQARSWITPEIKGVDGKRPVKARRVERNRCAVSFAKLDSTLGDRTTVSANRHVQHRFGDVDSADATVVYDAREALDCAAVAKSDFQHQIGR